MRVGARVEQLRDLIEVAHRIAGGETIDTMQDIRGTAVIRKEPLPGFDRSCASGINDQGLVVGYVDKEQDDPSRPVAVLWQDGQVLQIDTRGHTGAAVAVKATTVG